MFGIFFLNRILLRHDVRGLPQLEGSLNHGGGSRLKSLPPTRPIPSGLNLFKLKPPPKWITVKEIWDITRRYLHLLNPIMWRHLCFHFRIYQMSRWALRYEKGWTVAWRKNKIQIQIERAWLSQIEGALGQGKWTMFTEHWHFSWSVASSLYSTQANEGGSCSQPVIWSLRETKIRAQVLYSLVIHP